MIDRLRAAATDTPAVGAAAVGTLLVEEPDFSVEAVYVYFGEADTRDTVRIVVAGESLGFLSRSAALGLIELRSRGFGSSDYLSVPGREFGAGITVLCPVSGCEANPITVFAFDPKFPPSCPIHPGSALARAE
jgi:hypothetical protein